ALGDHAAAAEYRRIYETGQVRLDQQTWNGDYFIQIYDPRQHAKYQLGDGCLSDQLLGQWMAHVVDLGYVLPEDHVKKAIHSVYQYNFRETFSDHYNPQRIFALGDEAGLLLCSWPKGGRPPLPFVYSDEVWTGIEYQVAAHLIYEGFVDEGLDIVNAVRNRYDGERRNPWNEVECGHHYARAMASWSVMLALSGYKYSGPDKMISFFPKLNEDEFTGFWSNDAGWGVYIQDLGSSSLEADIQVLYGRVSLQKFSLPAPRRGRSRGYFKAEVKSGEDTYSVAAQRVNEVVIISIPGVVDLKAGESVHISVRS
ncbi:MAG: GH116 family glycosyl hydrolase, partial [Candidatus Hinthialibacter sp.]